MRFYWYPSNIGVEAILNRLTLTIDYGFDSSQRSSIKLADKLIHSVGRQSSGNHSESFLKNKRSIHICMEGLVIRIEW